MYSLLEHTTDIRMIVTGATLGELFGEALRGLMDVMEAEGRTEEATRADIELESVDATWLLVDFLSEALTLAHIRREAYMAVEFRELTETRLAATLAGVRVAGFAEDVKAVTVHDAEVRREDDGWTTMLVLDI